MAIDPISNKLKTEKSFESYHISKWPCFNAWSVIKLMEYVKKKVRKSKTISVTGSAGL
jgi:hypothetical protein